MKETIYRYVRIIISIYGNRPIMLLVFSFYVVITYNNFISSSLTKVAMGLAGIIVMSVGVVTYAKFYTKQNVVLAPASTALGLLAFFLPKKAYENIFEEMVLDYRQEYFDELQAGNTRRASWLTVCFYCNLAWTIVFWIGTSIVKKAFELWKMS